MNWTFVPYRKQQQQPRQWPYAVLVIAAIYGLLFLAVMKAWQ